jgi:multicomponent Na+:H+ antiporter subunit C
MSVYPYVVAVFVFCVGLTGVVTSRNLIHLIVSLGVAQSATYILLLSIGYRTGGTAPIQVGISSKTPQVDPVVQALTLTDVVVGVTVSALLLALALHVQARERTLDPERLRGPGG